MLTDTGIGRFESLEGKAGRILRGTYLAASSKRRSRHPGRAEDVTLHDVFISQLVHLLKGGAGEDRVRVAVLVPPHTVPRLDERHEGVHSRRRRPSALVRGCREVIRQARNVLNQLVDRGRRLWICQKSTDFVSTAQRACLLADEDGTRGDWLNERGDAIRESADASRPAAICPRPGSSTTCP